MPGASGRRFRKGRETVYERNMERVEHARDEMLSDMGMSFSAAAKGLKGFESVIAAAAQSVAYAMKRFPGLTFDETLVRVHKTKRKEPPPNKRKFSLDEDV